MAGLDDYQFYARLRDQSNPFWKKTDMDGDSLSGDLNDMAADGFKMHGGEPGQSGYKRPSDLPQRLHSTPSKSPRETGWFVEKPNSYQN